MPQIILTLTDDQLKTLLDLAADLRGYFATRRDGLFARKVRGKQKHPHRFDLSIDPWVDILQAELGKRTEATSSELFELLGVKREEWNAYSAKHVAECMRSLGWDGPKSMRVGRNVVRGYTRYVHAI